MDEILEKLTPINLIFVRAQDYLQKILTGA